MWGQGPVVGPGAVSLGLIGDPTSGQSTSRPSLNTENRSSPSRLHLHGEECSQCSCHQAARLQAEGVRVVWPRQAGFCQQVAGIGPRDGRLPGMACGTSKNVFGWSRKKRKIETLAADGAPTASLPVSHTSEVQSWHS